MRSALENDPARSDKILGRTPMKRFGEADDIGWAAVYLVDALKVCHGCYPSRGRWSEHRFLKTRSFRGESSGDRVCFGGTRPFFNGPDSFSNASRLFFYAPTTFDSAFPAF